MIAESEMAERQGFPTGFAKLCSFNLASIYFMISISDMKAVQCFN
jgi:hypothetical protein